MDNLREEYSFLYYLFFFIISVLLAFIGFALPALIINGICLGDLSGFFVSLLSLTIGSYIFF